MFRNSKSIEPDTKLRLLWDFLMLFYIIFIITLIPISLSFDMNIENLNFVIILIFCFDLIITMKTGFYSKGILILDSKVVFYKYFKQRFWLDLFSFFPFIISINSNYKEISIFFLLQGVRIKKISRKLNEYLQLSHVAEGIFNLIKLSLLILYIAHFFACVFHYIAIVQINSGAIDTWLHSKNLIHKLSFEKYVNSLYFSVVTMITVGYGDISPTSLFEKIFSIFFMQISCITYGYIINSIGSILMQLDKYEQELK